jgi:bacterioferritin-associated ferredoxin
MADTSIFDAYQEEYVKDSEEFRRSIALLQECGSNQDKKRSALSSCDSCIDKISNLLKEMEMEVRTYSSSNKRTCSEILSRDKEEFTTLKSEYNTAKFAAEKANLTGGKSGEDRRRMLDTNEK